MEKQFDDNEQKLVDYLDGVLSPEEVVAFEKRMQESTAFRKQVDEMRLMESTLRSIQPENPSLAFTNTVMSKINNAPSGYHLSIRNGILLLLGVFIVSLITAMLVQSGMFNGVGTISAPENLGMISKYVKKPLPSIPFDTKLIVNGIILLNLAIGFVVLDRAILRPYFERRMKQAL